MSKNRRRSTQSTAAIREQLSDTAGTSPTVAGGRRRSLQPTPAAPSLAADAIEEPAPGASNGRRRSIPPAEADPHWDAEGNRRSAAAEPPAERGRRRPAQGQPEGAGAQPRLDPAEPERAGRGRRRSAPDAGTAAPEPSAEHTVGALSGQLPHGTEYRAGEISTEAGRYLRRAARDDAPARFGAPTGAVDDAARQVWEIAFGLVVRRRFEPDSPLAEISRTVATAVHEHAAAGLPALDAEMLVRHALGEIVPVGDLPGDVLVAVHLLLFASIADELALGDEELDAIVAEAEEKVSALVPA
ncbi:hypothetical protein GCM10010172_23390 [Paractinoplanes ferrugineus]|uniref:Uncharacterized protein n=1 Tax=Paractinoplanes ferrugineus TaxID=113564 RepID=A0A919IUH8_9ACTN|nr:hypothetical protein [Actinoplanes ferrugineus]GIE08750.1 hypothetical protein Afe05nite_05900 [Actinoplanes ferrugineus]